MRVKMTRTTGLLLFVLSDAHAEENKNEVVKAIESSLEKCLDSAMTTADMNKCAGDSLDQYKEQMNITYNKLLKLLKGEAQVNLKKSQAAWDEFYAHQSKFIGSYWPVQGTMYSTVRIGEHADLYKDRLENLLAYLNTYELIKD